MALTIEQRDQTLAALKQSEWKIKDAAKIIGMSREGIFRRMRDLGIKREDFTSRKHNFNRAKTRCKRGHLFTARNTYTRPGTNFRTCRKCEANRSLEKHHAKKAAEREATRIPNHPLYFSHLVSVCDSPVSTVASGSTS